MTWRDTRIKLGEAMLRIPKYASPAPKFDAK